MLALGESRTLLALGLGLTAAAANVLGGLFIVRRDWSRQYLKYFLALGAGFMLSAAFLEMIPESVRLGGDAVLLMNLLKAQVSYALPLAAGVTVYVAASDLIPEVNREPGVRMALVVFLGVALMLVLHRFVHL